MGTGIGSEKIYQLIEELNCSGIDYGSSVVLSDLIRYLDADTLEDFIRYFRRNHDMEEDDDSEGTYEEDETELFENDYHLCMNCQDSYDINKPHSCNSKPFHVRYFSSLIPEC